MRIIRPSRKSDPAFGAISHFWDNPVSGMAPSLNLGTAWVKNWLIIWVFSKGSENIVDK